MRFSVLTVSDSSSQNPSLDKSGPLLIELFSNSLKFIEKAQLIDYKIVPDDRKEIVDYLHNNITEVDCILTTGGTGFAKRDVTPEATKEVIERECPGIVTSLLVGGLRSTPFAALTRLTAGISGNCLIINLPGSPKAVQEGFVILEEILPHAISLLKEDFDEIKKDHENISH
uniref:molybdopterin molybdotransferase n=2 Tax=Meloidogyne TaxID=189290 RepID=A0A915NK21_9BILA